MYTTFLDNEVNQIVRDEFRKEHYSQSYEVFTIGTSDMRIKLDDNSVYIIDNEQIDIPLTARLSLFSDCNYLTTSKEEFEYFSKYKIEKFRTYLGVIVENYGAAFIPFKLKFLKITPY